MRAAKKGLPELVRDAVDRGAKSAEEIHKAIAHLPLDVLGKVECLEAPAGEVKRIEDVSIGAVYDLLRKINHEVEKFASDLLPPPKHTARRTPHARAARAH